MANLDGDEDLAPYPELDYQGRLVSFFINDGSLNLNFPDRQICISGSIVKLTSKVIIAVASMVGHTVGILVTDGPDILHIIKLS